MSGAASRNRGRRCSIEGCDGPVFARGWCNRHYKTWRRNGDPTLVIPHPAKFKTQDVSERFWSKVHVTDGCWIWQASLNALGYGRFGLDGKVVGAHRVAYMLAVGPIPDGLMVLHHCDTPACVRPDHLYVGTHDDNMRDKADRKRVVVRTGPSHSNSKLSTAQVREIRERAASGEPVAHIARSLPGIGRTQVYRIVRGESRVKG